MTHKGSRNYLLIKHLHQLIRTSRMMSLVGYTQLCAAKLTGKTSSQASTHKTLSSQKSPQPSRSKSASRRSCSRSTSQTQFQIETLAQI